MAGMTLVDSIDSILMLYSYTGFPERSWILFNKSIKSDAPDLAVEKSDVESQRDGSTKPEEAQSSDVLDSLQQLPEMPESPVPDQPPGPNANTIPLDLDNRTATDTRVKMNVMSGISIILTLMSILVAFSISLITIMGLIGENCSKCRAAAEAEDGGGLAGSWWRGWAKANDNSGYIGAAIVGGFLAIVAAGDAYRRSIKKVRDRRK